MEAVSVEAQKVRRRLRIKGRMNEQRAAIKLAMKRAQKIQSKLATSL